MIVVEKRSHGRSPWREAFEMIATRPQREPSSVRMRLRFKQNAKGEWLVEELDVPQREHETDEEWFARCETAKVMAQEMVGYYAPSDE